MNKKLSQLYIIIAPKVYLFRHITWGG